MSIWRHVSERPIEGMCVAVLETHWKKEGWLSCELNFGEVAPDNSGGWYVYNNDYRGYGGETWTPEPEEYGGKDHFSHWCYLTDLPDLPEFT